MNTKYSVNTKFEIPASDPCNAYGRTLYVVSIDDGVHAASGESVHSYADAEEEAADQLRFSYVDPNAGLIDEAQMMG
jgi:hypothetical protein